jgi:hypothetical protein
MPAAKGGRIQVRPDLREKIWSDLKRTGGQRHHFLSVSVYEY